MKQFLCANCSISLNSDDIECCNNLSLGKLFCSECLFNAFNKLTGFTTEELQKYLLLDDGQFIEKMNIIKENLSKEFKKEGEWERH
jgi:hypothetical protein